MSLFQKVIPKEETNFAIKESSWSNARRDAVIDSLQKQGMYQILQPTSNELKLSDGIYVSGNFSNIDLLNEETISNLGEKELGKLNSSLKVFIDGLNLVASENKGLFDLMDDLSKTVNPQEMNEIWEKAVNAKPNLLEIIIGIFNSQYKKKVIINKLTNSATLIEKKGKIVGAKIDSIENSLLQQKEQQINNIKKLNETFELYYHAVKDLRVQYILIMYIQYNFKLSLNNFKQTNKGSTGIDFTKKLLSYERIDSMIDSKALLMQQSLMQILIAVKNNDNLIKVCQNLLFEINNTIIHSLPNIRTNIVTLAIALRAERGLKENSSVKELEEQQSILTQKILVNITVKAEELSGQSALKGANTMKKLVEEAEKFQSDILKAKENKRKDIDNAFNIMYDAQSKFNILINKV